MSLVDLPVLYNAGGMMLTLGVFACRDTAAALTDMLGTSDVWFWSSQQAEKQEFVQWAGRVLEHRCFQCTDTCLKAADGCLVTRICLFVIITPASLRVGTRLYMFADLPCSLVFMMVASWDFTGSKFVTESASA